MWTKLTWFRLLNVVHLFHIISQIKIEFCYKTKHHRPAADMNNSNRIIKKNWELVPTFRQLAGICDYYKLQRHKNATREEMFCLLEKNNVQMEISAYDGPQVELRGAIIHWIEDPEESSNNSNDNSNERNVRCPLECSESDNRFNEANRVPEPPLPPRPIETCDIKVDASLASYECCAPFDMDVQYEEEVETVECC